MELTEILSLRCLVEVCMENLKLKMLGGPGTWLHKVLAVSMGGQMTWQFYIFSNITTGISVTSGQWEGDHERLCAGRHHLGPERIPLVLTLKVLLPCDPKVERLMLHRQIHRQ